MGKFALFLVPGDEERRERGVEKNFTKTKISTQMKFIYLIQTKSVFNVTKELLESRRKSFSCDSNHSLSCLRFALSAGRNNFYNPPLPFHT